MNEISKLVFNFMLMTTMVKMPANKAAFRAQGSDFYPHTHDAASVTFRFMLTFYTSSYELLKQKEMQQM